MFFFDVIVILHMRAVRGDSSGAVVLDRLLDPVVVSAGARVNAKLGALVGDAERYETVNEPVPVLVFARQRAAAVALQTREREIASGQ